MNNKIGNSYIFRLFNFVRFIFVELIQAVDIQDGQIFK